MDAGVGTAGADCLYGLVGNQRECFFDALLYAKAGLLALPTVIGGAVVFDTECDANLRTC